MNKIKYLTVDFNEMVPIPNNVYTISQESVVGLIDVQDDKPFALVVSVYDNLSEIAAICKIKEQILDYNNDVYLLIEVIKLVVIKDLSFDYIRYEKFILRETQEEVDKSIIEILSKYGSLNLYKKTKKELREQENLAKLNILAAKIITDPQDMISYYETNSIYKKIILLYEYYTLLSEPINYESKKYPKIVLEKLLKEKQKIDQISPNNSEYSSTQDYINILESIPWETCSKNNIELKDLKIKLDKSHYGLNDVKSKILDLISISKLKKDSVQEVFLFNGPPGTGKTSFAKDLALTLGREYIYISMAGLGDEAELRGHRRTYLASKPGRIVYNLTKLHTIDPVIVFDEIDKISSIKGNPETALLEILDPVQNKEFIDRYLEVPLDLSKCIFICTSNDLNEISKPLLDRLNIINFVPYTKYETTHIIKNYIIPNAIKDVEKLNLLSIDQDLIEYFASNFTLRAIKKEIHNIMNRNAYLYLMDANSRISSLKDYKLHFDSKVKENKIGFKKYDFEKEDL